MLKPRGGLLLEVALAVLPGVASAQEAPGGAPAPEGDEATVRGTAPMSAASSQVVRDRDLMLRPRTRPADIFEVAPGLIVVQHAGGGKANQYFLRGFDADHGTDIALSLDDVPINMVSHGHGQGYADPHFLIPELVERIEVREGPYFAQDGDFATAGALNLRLRETVERSTLTVEDSLVYNPALGAGMLANPRFLGVLRTDVGLLRGYVAAEWSHTDGPFLNPQRFNHYNLVGRWGARVAADTDLSLTLLSYAGAWNASGQIPARLVDQPYMGRTFTQWDSVDPSEGGQSERHQASLRLRTRLSAGDELSLMAYGALYRFTLFSNFTYWLDDAARGDAIEQDDNRVMAGFRAVYRRSDRLGSWRLLTAVGATLRHDDIDNALRHVMRRQRLDDRRVDTVRETSAGLFVEAQIIPNRFARLVLGLRGDHFNFSVDDRRGGLAAPDPSRNGVAQDALLSPKATLVLSPLRRPDFDLDLYLNFGRGFHSNDARGAVIPANAVLAAQCADALRVPSGVVCPVTPLTVATGYELGVRTRLARRVDVSVAAWLLDLDQETVWSGDNGTTEPSGATRRMGVTVEARAQLLPWLWADVDFSVVHARFREDVGEGDAVPLAPPWVLSAGVSARHPSGFYGAARVRAIATRPADSGNNLQAEGFAIASANLGFRHAWWDVGVSVENLFNRTWREAQFEGDGRLPTEPAACPASNPGCFTDIKFTAGAPFTATLRLSASWR